MAVPAVDNKLDGIVAVIEVEVDPAATVSGVVTPLTVQFTIGFAWKLVPTMLKFEMVACPTLAVLVLSDEIAGAAVMVKVFVPGAVVDPVTTVTCAVPVVPSRLVATVAVSCVVLT